MDVPTIHVDFVNVLKALQKCLCRRNKVILYNANRAINKVLNLLRLET